MKKIIILLVLLALFSSCTNSKKTEKEKQTVVDSTMGIIDNSKVGLVEENLDHEGSFEGQITFQIIMQTKGNQKEYAPLKGVFGDTVIYTFSKGRYAMQYIDGKVEYLKYLRDNNQYRKMLWLDTLHFLDAGIETSTLYSVLKEKSDFEVLGRKLEMVSIITDNFKKFYYYDPNMYMNPEYFKKHVYGYENKYYEKAKAPYIYAEIEYENLKIILKPLSIVEKKIPDEFFKLPNYIIKASPTMGK